MQLVKGIATILLIWQLIAYTIGNSLIFPGVVEIFSIYPELLINPNFISSVGNTFFMLIKCWSITLILLFAILLGSIISDTWREMWKSIATILQPSPTFVWLPVFMLIFGINDLTVLIIVTFTSIWFVLLNLLATLEHSVLKWRKHCENLFLSKLQSLWLCYLPSMKNVLLANFKTSWNLSWRTIIALEVVFGVIGNHWGVGAYMITVKEKMDISEMYAMLFVIIAIGIVTNVLFDLVVERKANA